MVKKIIFSLFSFLFIVAVLLIFGEVLVRYLQDRNKPPSKVRQRDSITHHSFVPNSHDVARTGEWEMHFDINSQGLRDREYPLEKPADTYRILMVGDSFIEGQGVEVQDTVSKLLEKQLNTKGFHKKIEVINAGVLSYSPLTEYQYLKYRGLLLHPDLVILNFDQGDVIDDQWYESELIKDAQGNPLKFQPDPNANSNPFEKDQLLPFIPLPVKKFMHDHSRLYLVVANSIRLKKLKLYPEIGEAEIVPGDPGKDKLIVTRDTVANYDSLWTLTKRNLTLINSLLNDNKVDFVLSVYPYGHQVNSTEWSIGRKAWQFENKTYTNDHVFKTLEDFSKENNVKFFNMTPDFRAQNQHPMFYKLDGHWTKLGHIVAERSLEGYLTKQYGERWSNQ